MALTLEKAQRLERVGLAGYFSRHETAWTATAKDAYDYIKKGFAGQPVRPDDVVPPLISVAEIDSNLRTFLAEKKLSQKYWIKDFAEFVLDRTWPTISANGS